MNWRTIALFAGMFFACWFVWHLSTAQSRAAFEGHQAHDYLCYQKTVVIPAHIAATIKYEQDVQLGLRSPIPGLTTADLATGIKRDQAALKALSRVKC